MSTTIGSVTITRNPAFGTAWHHIRFNQQSIRSADATSITYDNGPNVIEGILIINNVSKTEAGSLLTYLKGTAIFGKNSFTITPPTNTDLGKGAGTAITCYYNGGNDFDGVFTLMSPGVYKISLPYWFKET